MSSVMQNFPTHNFFPTRPLNDALPISNSKTDGCGGGGGGGGCDQEHTLRRRLSSLSLKIQPISEPANQWAMRRSKSVSLMGEYAGSSVKKWWEWSWAWILSKKPIFAQDLEMNEEETKVLGAQNKGSWMHVFFKVRSEIRKLVGSDNHVVLPH